jgi:hypothetical protein
MYEAVLRDGGLGQQLALLDKETLIHVWPGLILPDRCRQIWEDKCPELTRQPVA